MYRLTALSAFALLAGTTIAMADGVVPPESAAQQPTFESIDRNGDHRISKTEAGGYKSLIDRFAYLDTDGDGFISESEFAAARSTLKSTP